MTFKSTDLVLLYLNCVSKSEIIAYDGLEWF